MQRSGVGTWMMAAVVLLGGSTAMRAQTSGTVKDDLFAGTEKFAQNASSVTEVDMDPDTLGMVNGSNSSRARRTVLSVVHTYTYDKPGMYNIADVDAFRNKLNTGDWHCSVHVRELKSGESTDVCRKRRGDDLEESAIITVEPKELTFIHTIRRPSTQSKPGGSESWLSLPMELGLPGMDGVPMSAWAAEMRANAAEMRALATVDRAEMGALSGLHGELLGGNFTQLFRGNGVDSEQMRELTRQLKEMPTIEIRRASPWLREQTPRVPKQPVPPTPAQPQKQSTPSAAQHVPATA